ARSGSGSRARPAPLGALEALDAAGAGAGGRRIAFGARATLRARGRPAADPVPGAMADAPGGADAGRTVDKGEEGRGCGGLRVRSGFQPRVQEARWRGAARVARALRRHHAGESAMSFLLALDQGTSSSRSIVFDADGRIAAMAQREFRQLFPQPGWVEHDALEIWSAQLATAREALADAGMDDRAIAGIGITNQRETTVIWERATGRPIHNAIVWQDRRTEPI